MPEIRFRIDTALDYAEKIDRLLQGPGRSPATSIPTKRMKLGSTGIDGRDDLEGMTPTNRPWLGRARQAGGHDVDAGRRARCSGCSMPTRPGMRGTLDPLASGLLPIALGEATKTVQLRHGWAKDLSLHRQMGRGALDATIAKVRLRATSDSRPIRMKYRSRFWPVSGRDHAGAAGLFGDQDRRRAGL